MRIEKNIDVHLFCTTEQYIKLLLNMYTWTC